MGESVGGLASPMTFTADGALGVLRGVCEAAGVEFKGAHVFQPPADNAMIFVPAARLVARIGVDMSHRQRLKRELDVAAWLVSRGLPTPAPASFPPCPQLTEAQGRIVTWWQYVPSREHADVPGLMSALRVLHGQPTSGLLLARLDPWARIENQLRAATGLSSGDRGRLVARWGELRQRWTRSRWPDEQPVVIHGDAHALNTLVYQGSAYLLDLEDVRLGPWQWDAISPLIHLRAGWITPDEYSAAIGAYGRDPSADEDIEVLVAVRLLRMTCWLASRTGREPAVVERVRRRIAYLEDPGLLVRRPEGF